MALRPWPFRSPPLAVSWLPNWASPQAAGLIAWFPTVDAVAPGMIRDRMGGPVPTVSGNVAVTPRPGVGKALTFDGTDDYLVWTDALANFSGRVSTLAFWARLVGQDAFGSIVFSTSTGAAVSWQFIYSSGSGTTRVYVHGSSPATVAGTVLDSEWHHWALVSAGVGSQTVYRDGVVVGTAAGTPANVAAGAKTWNIGRYTAGTSWDVNGDMADIRLYNRALSAAEVFALWAPQSRWDLYAVPVARRGVVAATGSVGVWGARPELALPGGVSIGRLAA